MADTFLNPVELAEIGSTPSNPASGYKKIYAKTDGKVYALNAAGEEVELTPALAIAAGTNSRSTGGVTFANSNGVTFGMDTNGVITASHNGLTTAAQSNHSHGVTLALTNISGTTGGNSSGIQLSLSAAAQSVDTNKAGTGATTAGNNIGLSATLNTNGLSLSASVSAQSQQTQNIIQQVIAGTQTKTAGTLSFANSNGISFGMSGSNTITASYTVPTQTADTNKAGTGFTSAGNNIGLSGTLNTNGLSLSATVPAQTTQPSNIVAAGTQTANTSGTVVFSNSNNVTFGMSNNSVITASASFSQSVDTGKAGTGISSSSVAGVNVVGTLNTNGLSLGVPNYITTAAQTDHTHGAVAFTGTNVSASFTSASNGLSIQLSAPAGGTGGGAGGVAIAGGTNTRTSGTVNFSNSNGVSFGLNTDGVMTAAGGGAIAAGSQLATQGTVSFVNSNGVSFGMSGSSQITAQIAPHTYTLIGNTVGNSTVSGVNFVLSGGNNITLSGTSNTIVISAAAGGGGGAPNRFYVEINQGERLTTIRNMSETIFRDRPFFFPFWVDGTGVAINTVRMFVSGVASSNRSLGLTLNAGLYSLVNATQISLLTSGQLSYSITASSQSTQWNGPAIMDFTGMAGFTMSQEGRYMLALQVRPVSANTAWANMAIYGCDNYPSFSRFLSGNTTGVTANTLQLLPWQGAYSTTSAGLPSTVARTQIHGGNSASAYQPYAVIMGI